MELNFLELILGFILGVLTNFAVWAIFAFYFIPDICFSPSISKKKIALTETDRSGYRYRFRIENSGTRDVIDIELMARLSVLIKGHWNTIYIPLSPDGSPNYRMPILEPVRKDGIGRRRTIFLYTNSTDVLKDWSIFPTELRKKAREQTLLLEDLMSAGKAARLQIFAYCYDGFSGTRKLFRSKIYMIEDIIEGRFDPKGLSVVSKKQEFPASSSQKTPASAYSLKDSNERDIAFLEKLLEEVICEPFKN